MTEFPSAVVRKLAEIRPASTFLTVRNYTNNFGELSDFSLCFHFNYLNAVKRSQEKLSKLKLDKSLFEGKSYSLNDLMLARKELLESFADSLAGNNPRYACKDIYELVNHYGEVVKGIKIHKRQDVIHLVGLLAHKRVISKGNYPQSYHSKYTLAKNALRELLPVSRFRQFKLCAGKFGEISVEKLSILPIETVREM